MPITRPCEICGVLVSCRPSAAARGQGRFCSRQCRNKDRWARHRQNINEWFWGRVDKSKGVNACWPWRGHKLKTGYGRLVIGGRWINAHRVAFELEHKQKLGDLFACHHCDNPICCNPSHLFAGTHQDNMDDMMAKGRKPSGARHWTALKARTEGG